MASSSAATAAVPKQEEDAAPPVTIEQKAELLYQRCAERSEGTVFFQRDLTSLEVAETLEELFELVSKLDMEFRMKKMTFDGETCFKLRSNEEAAKLIRLNRDELTLYQHIDAAQSEGVWSKALRLRTNMTPQALTKCLKSLESKDLVQSVMSVKFPNRKMYFLKNVSPSEEVAGGVWQDNGDFDMALINAISIAVCRYIEDETAIKVPGNWNDYTPIEISEKVAQKKAQVHAVRDIEEAPPVRPYRPPMDPNSNKLVHRNNPQYPTAASVAAWLNSRKVLRNQVCREEDMEQLLEMMVLDGRLEKTSATNYRTVLTAADQKAYNGFVDAPCGNCPVFDLCEDEGEISARTCVYFGEWLGTESAAV